MTWTHDRDIPGFDPYQTDTTNLRALSAPYSSLLRYDPLDVTKLLPDLAESWDISADGLMYTFHLRNGVKFHDGVAMTSEDVKFSLDTLYNPKSPQLSARRTFFAMVKSVAAPDASTVTVALKNPAAEFLPVLGLAISAIVPKRVYEAKGDMQKDMVGTGPFKFKSYQPGVSLEYVRNEDYYDKNRPYLDGLKFLILKDAAPRAAAFETGVSHITGVGNSGPTASDAARYEATMKDKVTIWRTLDFGAEAIKMNATRRPWGDIQVRKAVHLAFDRQAYGKLVFEDAFTVGGFVPPGFWALPTAELLAMPGFRQPKDADRTEAKRLLAAAGFPDGFTTTMLVQSNAAVQRRSEFLQNQLMTIGIKATLDVQESTAFNQRLADGNYDCFIGGEGEQLADPSPNLNSLVRTGGPRNYSRTSFPDVDKLIDEQAAEQNVEKRKAIVFAVQRRLLDLLPYIPLGNALTLVGMQNTVRNWKMHDGRFSFLTHRDTWLSSS